MEEGRRKELIILMGYAGKGCRDNKKHEEIIDELCKWFAQKQLKKVQRELHDDISDWFMFSRSGLKYSQKQYIDSMLALMPHVKEELIHNFIETLKTVARLMPDDYKFELIPETEIDNVTAAYKKIQADTEEEMTYMMTFRKLYS